MNQKTPNPSSNAPKAAAKPAPKPTPKAPAPPQAKPGDKKPMPKK